MSEENNTYRQPVKRKVRETVLRHAVESLTRKRESSPLVTIDRFDLLTDYCIRQFALAKKNIREPMAIIDAQWKAVHASRVGCGPEPLNDLTELTDLGLPAENVWAIEGDRKTHRAAADQLQKAGIPIKLHLGSLHEFLTVVPEQFDICISGFDRRRPLRSPIRPELAWHCSANASDEGVKATRGRVLPCGLFLCREGQIHQGQKPARGGARGRRSQERPQLAPDVLVQVGQAGDELGQVKGFRFRDHHESRPEPCQLDQDLDGVRTTWAIVEGFQRKPHDFCEQLITVGVGPFQPGFKRCDPHLPAFLGQFW